jgi:hypothetical protein
MALTYDQISAITEKKFMPKLVDNIFNSIPTLQRWKKKEKPVDGGERVVVPLNYAQNSAAGWYTGSDTLSTTDNEVITAAEFTWKQLYANISISRLDELKNSGDSQVINFVKAKTEIAEKTIRDQLAEAVYNAGTTANQISGLRLMTAITGTYGGIAKGTYSWWQGQVDSTTTTLSLGALQSLYGLCSVGSDTPSLITSTQANYDRFYGLLTPQQRFSDSETAKAGFTSLMFNGQPWIVDSKCPTGYIWLLNEEYIDLMPHKDENFRFEPFQKPINQNVKSAKIFWTGVLACSNCRMQGMFSGITA